MKRFALLIFVCVCLAYVTCQTVDPEISIHNILTEKIINRMKEAEGKAKIRFESKMLQIYEDYKKKSKLPQSAFQSINITEFTTPTNVKSLQESMRDVFQQFKSNFDNVLATSGKELAAKKQKVAPGTTFRHPASSCQQILLNSKAQASAPNGLYWINPNNPAKSGIDTSQQNCFMTYGGYSLISKIGKDAMDLTIENEIDEHSLLMNGEKAQYASDKEFATLRYADFNDYAQNWILKMTNFAQVVYVSPNPSDVGCTLHKAITATCTSPLRTLTSDHHIIRSQDIAFNSNLIPKSQLEVLNLLTGTRAVFLLHTKL